MNTASFLYTTTFNNIIDYDDIWFRVFCHYKNYHGGDYEQIAIVCDELIELIKENETIFKNSYVLEQLLPKEILDISDIEIAFKAYKFLQEKGKIK